MRRSTGGLLVTLVLALLAAPPAAEAQQPARVPRIGYLFNAGPALTSQFREAFRRGLRDLGYVEGENIAIEYRYAEGRSERLLDLAADLVRLKVDVIVAPTQEAALAAKNATGTIPIVMTSVGDPVAAGFVESLARPGGNLTGLSIMAPELIGKQLELLKEILPKVSRVAVLADPANPMHAVLWHETQTAGRALKVKLQLLEVRGPSEINRAFGAATRGRAGGLLVPSYAFSLFHRTQIVELAAKNRLPAIYGYREFMEVGGLVSYGASLSANHQRAATFVDKILKGAKPADLPVEQPTRFELVVNLKTAKALGLTISPAVLIRADQVIQ